MEVLVVQVAIAIGRFVHQIHKAIVPENILGSIGMMGIHHLSDGFIDTTQGDNNGAVSFN